MTAPEATVVAVDDVERLAVEGLRWLAGAARETAGGGLAWTTRPSDDKLNPMLYSGTAGIVPVFLEAWRHFGDDAYADTALRAARSLADSVDGVDDDSLYFGRTGMALVLRSAHEELGDAAAGAAADRALELVRSRFDGARWGEQYELMGGNAGIGLGALVAGDAELAVLAVEPYLRTAELEHRPTPRDLEPGTGWGMGNAGIVRELLRFVRLSRGGDPRYAFAWPDQAPVRGWAPIHR
ncbi:lanthionine synthetase LanC family protein [Streptomyces lydicus]